MIDSCFVRARRLNVIIQPHLRFVYELMKWDERLQLERAERSERGERGEPKQEQGEGAELPQGGNNGRILKKKGKGIKREMEWQSICREIANMNRPYARS